MKSERITKKEERRLRRDKRILKSALELIRASLFPPSMPKFAARCDRQELLERCKRSYDMANEAIKRVELDT